MTILISISVERIELHKEPNLRSSSTLLQIWQSQRSLSLPVLLKLAVITCTEYHSRFERTLALITITVGSHYQLAMIVHHYSRFVPLTSDDDVLLITASSPYELVVKTVFTVSLLYVTTVITML